MGRDSDPLSWWLDGGVRGAIAWLVASLLASQLLAPASYSRLSNTPSELGAQGYEHAWVTRAGFIAFGVLLTWTFSGDLVHVRRHWIQALSLVLYGSCIALTGVFSTAPFEGGVAYSEPESLLHSIFAAVAGVCLSGAMLVGAWRAADKVERWRHVAALILVTLASALFVARPDLQGVWQGALWVGGLTWLWWA